VAFLELQRMLRAVLNGVGVVLGILVQLVVIALLCNVLPMGAGIALFFTSPFVLGLVNYFLHHRVTGQRAVCIAAERRLAERKLAPEQRARKLRIKQASVWAPIVIVTIAFLFLPETFGVVTHLLRRSARQAPYEIDVPLTWMVFDTSDMGWYSTEAFQSEGLWRSGFRRYWRLEPRTAGMNFWAARNSAQSFPESQEGETLGLRKLQIGGESIICREYAHRFVHIEEGEDLRTVDCRNADGAFSASFYGYKNSLPEFYRTLENVRVNARVSQETKPRSPQQ
jgi:hypothetical protein